MEHTRQEQDTQTGRRTRARSRIQHKRTQRQQQQHNTKRTQRQQHNTTHDTAQNNTFDMTANWGGKGVRLAGNKISCPPIRNNLAPGGGCPPGTLGLIFGTGQERNASCKDKHQESGEDERRRYVIYQYAKD